MFLNNGQHAKIDRYDVRRGPDVDALDGLAPRALLPPNKATVGGRGNR